MLSASHSIHGIRFPRGSHMDTCGRHGRREQRQNNVNQSENTVRKLMPTNEASRFICTTLRS